jgi:hypothetical protein
MKTLLETVKQYNYKEPENCNRFLIQSLGIGKLQQITDTIEGNVGTMTY